jgi:hypothetical protein
MSHAITPNEATHLAGTWRRCAPGVSKPDSTHSQDLDKGVILKATIFFLPPTRYEIDETIPANVDIGLIVIASPRTDEETEIEIETPIRFFQSEAYPFDLVRRHKHCVSYERDEAAHVGNKTGSGVPFMGAKGNSLRLSLETSSLKLGGVALHDEVESSGEMPLPVGARGPSEE